MRRDLIALAALSAVVFGLGLTTHGLTNWQEAQRLLVAQEMQASGNWIVPTIHGQPYLAKPPLFYWLQVGAANLFGRTVGIFELRLVAALAGIAGVLCTYGAARLFFHDFNPAPTHRRTDHARWARDAAWWTAICLATGLLYVRSSRTGELDIVLVPICVAAVWAVAAAWRSHRDEDRANIPALSAAVLLTTLACLTKGPPALLVIAVAAYGGIATWCALSREPLETRWLAGGRSPPHPAPAPAHSRIVPAVAAAVLATTVPVFAEPAEEWRGHAGLLLLVLMAAAVGYLLGRLIQPHRFRAFVAACSRTHPALVLGIPLAVLWLWSRAVAANIGEIAVTDFTAEEAEDNIRLFVPRSPVINLTAAAFGVGLGSVLAIACLFWMVRTKPRLRPGLAIMLAWTGLGIVVFSLLGKGVQRYLTPVWPAIAMLGGLYAAVLWRDATRPRLARSLLVAAIVALASFETWWYAIGRETYQGQRSPRSLMAELLPDDPGSPRPRFATFEFRSPAVEYYARSPVITIGEINERESIAGRKPLTLDEFAGVLRDNAVPYILLVRAGVRHGEPLTPLDRLALAGMTVQTIPVGSRFTIDRGRQDVIPVLVTLASPPSPARPR